MSRPPSALRARKGAAALWHSTRRRRRAGVGPRQHVTGTPTSSRRPAAGGRVRPILGWRTSWSTVCTTSSERRRTRMTMRRSLRWVWRPTTLWRFARTPFAPSMLGANGVLANRHSVVGRQTHRKLLLIVIRVLRRSEDVVHTVDQLVRQPNIGRTRPPAA